MSNCVLPVDITIIQIRRPDKINDPILSLDFQSHRPADDETARGENTAAESPQAEAGRAKTRCSINGKTALRAGVAVLSQVALYIECFSIKRL
jgi:hypothetical protein